MPVARDQRQGSEELASPCFEATPEMVEAGWDALLNFATSDFPDRVMVTDVFRAMMEAAPRGWPSSLKSLK